MTRRLLAAALACLALALLAAGAFEARVQQSQDEYVRAVKRGDGAVLIVDSSADPIYFPDLEPLSDFSRHKEFRTYSVWRRTRALRSLPPNFVSLGPLAYLFENPHALLAGLCFLAAAALCTLSIYTLRRLPHRRTRVSADGFHTRTAFEG